MKVYESCSGFYLAKWLQGCAVPVVLRAALWPTKLKFGRYVDAPLQEEPLVCGRGNRFLCPSALGN